MQEGLVKSVFLVRRSWSTWLVYGILGKYQSSSATHTPSIRLGFTDPTIVTYLPLNQVSLNEAFLRVPPWCCTGQWFFTFYFSHKSSIYRTPPVHFTVSLIGSFVLPPKGCTVYLYELKGAGMVCPFMILAISRNNYLCGVMWSNYSRTSILA